MKFILVRITAIIVISLLVFNVKGLSSSDKLFELFEKEISKTEQFDSLGQLKERIQFSKNVSLIPNARFLKEINENPNESFYIKSDKNSLMIIGTTNQALEHGVFFYLHHLGFRYYFPNPNWHYFPDIHAIFKPIEGVFSPDYLNRRLSYGYRTGSEIATQYFYFWRKANLMGKSIPGFTGHAYEQIVRRNRKVFLNHPEYFAQNVEKGEIPNEPKFDVSNPDLVRLVVEDAMKLAKKYYETYGPEFIISLDPSDGGGYCIKPSCKKWKSVSDQVYYLANVVAKELKRRYPKAYIGLYAYNFHSVPPSFELEDNIIIYIATYFNTSAYSYDELISFWKQKVEHIGIRDYYGVVNWDWDLPGQGKGTKPFQIHKSINKYYSDHARFYYIESLNGWITKGIGHYVAARTLWDINIKPIKEIEEFYELMFPETQHIMQPLMDDLMGYSRETPLDIDIQDWITNVMLAYKEVNQPNERNRIEDVMQYLYAMVLFIRRGSNGVESYKDLFKFLEQTNDNSNYATYAMRRILFSTFKEIMPEKIITTRSSAINYKSSIEIDYIQGLDSILQILKPLHWTPFAWDKPELQFNKINIGSTRSGKSGKPISFRENHLFLIELIDKSRISIIEGLVDYKNKSGGLVQLFKYEDDELINPIYEFELFPDSVNELPMTGVDAGKYWMQVSDNREGFRFTRQSHVHIAIFQDKTHPLNTFYRNEFYFVVPEQISQFVIRKTGSATIISPSGRIIDLEQYGRNDVNVQIKETETGFWKVENQKGFFIVEGIPPFFAQKKEDLPFFIEKNKCFLLFWK